MSNISTNEFITQHGLSFRVKQVDARPDGFAGGMGVGATHWEFTFQSIRTDKTLTGFFSQGAGHGPVTPEAWSVLSSCALDAQSADDAIDQLDFAHVGGWVLDTHAGIEAARACHAACQKTYDDLISLLGDYEHLVSLYKVISF